MGDLLSAPVEVRAAGAQARAAAAVVAVPVRPIDPARPRFEVEDGGQAARKAPAKPEAESFRDQIQPGRPFPDMPVSGRRGPGLVGAFTAFVAKLFTQDTASAGLEASAVLNGARAYGRAARPTAQPDTQPGMDILSPSFPRLASGRILDLTV
ncbi:hypothetical protein [Magnetospirillum sp. UT-4]|uniref:hypothetical protein n=1 Tax=Magnetospirillum sp. UT-4 TaxID=2681467 RepID=UPI001574B3F2|nr:hypothetical protein [Magnetospirillum sp. UT-4]